MRASSDLQTLPDLLRMRARLQPDAPFLTYADRCYTYGAFDALTDELAGGLAELGVGAGDVVSVSLPNCPEFLTAWWAILKAGAVFGPINPAYTATEAGYVLGHSRAVAMITNRDGAEVIDPIRDELRHLRDVVDIDAPAGSGRLGLEELASRGSGPPVVERGHRDLAGILYTSGTTGKPKGAMLSHQNLLVNAAQGAELVPLGTGERVGMLLPLFHANAQVVTTLIPMLIGSEVVMWERFSASRFWAEVNRLSPVTISAVPTILAAVLSASGAPEGPTSLRYVICGAAPLSVELLRAFQERFAIRILEGFGMTETGCIASLNPYYGERKVGSIGLTLRGQEMKIIDQESGADAAPGEYGEIVIKGPNVMMGYLHNPKATAETITDGWLHSGDIGYMDDDGYFYIVDRAKDMIIRGGENIYPREIEEALCEHDAVLECAVIGIPDPIRGEEVLAVVVTRDGATFDPDELATFATQRLATYKLPKQIALRSELPRTPTGKISKGPLRDEFGSWHTVHAAASG